MQITKSMRISLLIFLFAITCLARAEANRVAVVASLKDTFDLSPYIEYLPDPARNMSYKDILAGKYDKQWQRNRDTTFIGRDHTVRYWFRFSVTQTETIGRAILYSPIHHSFLHELNLWITTAGETQMIEAGHLRPLINTPFGKNIFAFQMPQQTQYSVVGWGDNLNAGMPVFLPLELISFDKWILVKQYHFAATFGFYAVMFAFFVYNLCLFISLRDKMYGTYLLFLISGIGTCFAIDGMQALMFFEDTPRESYRVQGLNGITAPVLYLLFFWTALNDFSFSSNARNVIVALILSAIPFTVYLAISNDFSYAALVTQGYSGLMIITTLVILVIGIIKRVPSALILLTAEIGNVIGSLALLLMMQGFISFNVIANWSLHFGMLFEVILLSLALAERTRLAQQKAITNLEKYEKLFEESHEGLFHWEIVEKQTKCNDAFARMFGYNDKFDMYANQHKYNDPQQNKELYQLLLNNNGIVKDHEFLIPKTAARNNVWVTLNMSLSVDNENKPLRVEGSMVDITERKLKEEAEYKKAITEAQSQAKNQFFASMSHELRTPLTAVLGYAEIAQRDDLPDAKRLEHLATIERSGKHLLHLINDVLDLSKIEAQKLEMESITVSLIDIIRDIEDNFSILTKQKDIDFTVIYQFPLPEFIVVDPTRLKQILINLCGNAVKFTKQGGVTLEVYFDAPTEKLCFAVKDSGVGLTGEQIAQLFQAFTQGDLNTSRQFGGTGLGLHLSKQIATMMGGTISVASEVGKGSTFTLSIKHGVLSDVSWLDAVPDAISNDRAAAIPQLAGRILYAEDNIQNQLLMAELVNPTGVIIEFADNGQEALSLALQGTYDLVITDLSMPVMDGIAFATALRAQNQDIPLVALSAQSLPQRLADDESEIFQAFLKKPISSRTLYNTLRLYLPATLSNDQRPAWRPPVALVAEVIAANQSLIAYQLKLAGFKVKRASDGVEAMLCALQNSIDIAFVDKTIPHLNGLEVVKTLRSKEFTYPMYILSSDDNKEAEADYITAGCTGVLHQSIDVTKFANLVHEFKSHHIATNINSMPEPPASVIKGLVLLADDDRSNKEIVSAYLDPYPVMISTVSNGQEALDALSTKEFDLLIIDQHMPLMTGLETINEIRRRENGSAHLPILCLSGSVTILETDELAVSGANGYLAKPASRDALIKTLEIILSGGRSIQISHNLSHHSNSKGNHCININAMNENYGDAGMIQTTIGAFIDNYSNTETHLADQLNNSEINCEELEFYFHNLANSASNLFADEVKTAAHKLEQCCRENNVDDLRKILHTQQFQLLVNKLLTEAKELCR